VASLTPANKGILDKEFTRLARDKEELEAQIRKIENTEHKEVDINATVDEIMASVRGFEDLFPQGTLEEQKEFLRLWIEKIELDPDKRAGKVYMKKFPLPANGNGNSSFEMVAGARFEPATFGL
jgi:predicted nuclease with TOPRIM domain